MQILFRDYVTDDYEPISQLANQLVESEATYNPTRLPIPSFDYGPNFIQEAIINVHNGIGIITVAIDDDKIVGYCIGNIKIQSKKDLLEYKQHKIGHISDVYVSLDYRKMGIGKKFMEMAETFFKEKGCDYIELDVSAKNEVARQLYLRLGFQENLIQMLKKL
jgi:ribosomal protein S18 acetylase RimI-like enzyme